MTREKANNIARGITDKIEATTDIDDWAEFWGFTRDDYEEFLDVAIKALSAEPCEDCISRAEAIKALNCEISGSIESDIDLSKYKREFQEFANIILNAQEKAIQALPPVTPQPKTDVLDKIMKEIKEIYADIDDVCIKNGLNLARRIINKYKAESEDKE